LSLFFIFFPVFVLARQLVLLEIGKAWHYSFEIRPGLMGRPRIWCTWGWNRARLKEKIGEEKTRLIRLKTRLQLIDFFLTKMTSFWFKKNWPKLLRSAWRRRLLFVPPDEGCCVLGRFSDLIIKLWLIFRSHHLILWSLGTYDLRKSR